MTFALQLNDRARRLADHVAATAAQLRVDVQALPGGGRIIDCGVKSEGGMQAGLALARICLAGLADVNVVQGSLGDWSGPLVQLMTDWPVAACMASQYAGWQISVGKYFAMGSGPMRAATAAEELFDDIGYAERPEAAVGVLETRKLPDDAIVQYVSEQTKVSANKITLLVAPAASQAGSLQVVARSVETALHKLHELKFDLKQVVSAFGSAPLAPVAKDEIAAIGRTNDAILYGGRVTLWVRTEDALLEEVGPQVPSSSSKDYGMPFAEVFEKYDRDFYKIDKLLFSPAEITFCNLASGRTFRFGGTDTAIVRRSFEGNAT